ncbi:OVALY protein, partial [Arenaria interpres]|nr:OVALY protein [Arenaria interpres]
LFLFALDNTDFTMGSISAANAEFCFDVFRELKVHHANDNIFYSPLSIISALAMVYLGARGNTQSQMEKVLHFDNITGVGDTNDSQCGTSEYLHNSFKNLLSDITTPNATYSLKIAERLYIEKTYPILPEYLKCAKKFYKAGLEEVNFKTATEEARQLVNSWVEKETNGQIQDLLVSGSVDFDTALALVNAIYFKGIWKTAFKEEDTQEMPFNVTELEKKISFEKLTEWTSPNVMEKRRVKVYLPRMKIQEKYNLTSILTALGMTDLFSPSANLSGISSAENLKISEAIHEAYMEVNEEGTEMAGSAGVMGDIKHSSELEEFRADHPFLFFIKHNPTNSILFFGKYCSP